MLAKSKILPEIAQRTTFVLIERRDKLAQAISHVIAEQTGRWASFNPDSKITPKFDADAIKRKITFINSQYAAMKDLFSENAIAPINVTYEQFCISPESYVAEIGRAIGLEQLSFEQQAVVTVIPPEIEGIDK